LLAEYVLGELFKTTKSTSELREICVDMLKEFLGDNTTAFVDRLFKTIAGFNSKNFEPAERMPREHAPQRNGRGDRNHREHSPPRYRNDDYHGGKRRYEDDDRRMQVDDYRRGNKYNRRHEEGPRNVHQRLGYQQQQHRNQPEERQRSNRAFVKDVPRHSCNAKQVYDYFQRFGHVQSVRVYPSSKCALVEFSQDSEAEAAVKSPEAAFGNRFVKIFWFRNSDLDGVNEAEMDFFDPSRRPSLTEDERMAKLQEAQTLQKELQEKKRLLAQQQEEERKNLLEQMSHLNEEDKQKILGSLNVVSQAVAAASVAEGQFTKVAKSAVMEDEAKMDMSSTSQNPSATSYGRGRGRGSYRGSYPRVKPGRSQKLDLRPKTIKVSGYTPSFKPFLQGHFAQFGTVQNVSFNGNEGEIAEVQFEHRYSAEQALLRGNQPNNENFTLELQWSNSVNPGINGHSSAGDAAMTDSDMVIMTGE
jgi:RNA recognition motif-containing protein